MVTALKIEVLTEARITEVYKIAEANIHGAKCS